MNTAGRACDRCLARPWLLERLRGHLDRVRGRIAATLVLPDDDLIAAVAGADRERVTQELGGFDAAHARVRCRRAGVEPICRCDPAYPSPLTELAAPPAVIHVAGDLERFLALARDDGVAIVGARRASADGLEVATALARGLGAAGLLVLSGMALGIDSAAHAGALAAAAPTVAVLPGGADRPYPAGRRGLHRRIQAAGAAISELPPGVEVRRWMFPARNRLIAALAAMTVVVEAGEHSGALITAAHAEELGRIVGAVPGRVSAPLAAGPNALLARGAAVVRGAQDVLDRLFGVGAREAAAGADRDPLSPALSRVLADVAGGRDTAAALERSGHRPEQALAALASLELRGYVRRQAGGRFVVVI
jgi:DNA processing protein